MTEAEDAKIDAEDAPPVDSDGSVASAARLDPTTKAITKKNRKRAAALVETQVRMSPRVQKNKQGLKDPVCKDKSYLGCNSTPPPISTKTIRKLSASLYDIEASQVTNLVLNKKKGVAPIGTVPPKKKNKEVNDESNEEAKVWR